MTTLLEAVIDHGAVVINDGSRVFHTVYLPCGDEGPAAYERAPGYIDTNGLEWYGWTWTHGARCGAWCPQKATGMATFLCHLNARPELHYEPKCTEHGAHFPFEAFTPFAAAI